MKSPHRVGNHSNRSRHHLSLHHLLRSNQVHERLRVEVRSEEKGVRDARACDASDSHQRGISTNESAVERKDIIDIRCVIFESSADMVPSQLGRNKTNLNTARPSGFSRVSLFGPGSILDRIVNGRVRTDRHFSCGDNLAFTDCIENATCNMRSGQEALVAEENR